MSTMIESSQASIRGLGFFSKRSTFRKFAVANLAYTIAVILWGAWVRATGSGAGCGEHWPLCNGTVLPRAESIQTLIEFTHRATSGISLILVVYGFFWARALTGSGSILRRITAIAVIAIFLEAALGAGLVLLKLVALDQSAMRAISIALHLMNTTFLVGSLVTVVYFSKFEFAYDAGSQSQIRGLFPQDRFFRGAIAVFVLLGMSGAIAALGDTLFPAETLLTAVINEFDPKPMHFLERLRIVHPILAIAWVLLAFLWSRRFESLELLKVRNSILLAVIAQFVIGFLNWILMAPNWMQIVHLFFAEVVFIVFWRSGLIHETRESRK